jgi:flagellar protein FliO/FliZ
MSFPLRFMAAAYAAIACVLLLAPTALAAAADKAADKAPPAQSSYGEDKALDLPSLDEGARQLDASGASGGGSLVRTFVGLAVVLAVIYGLYWVLKQVKSSREERSSGTGLSSFAVVPLGANRSLHLIRAGRELVLVGVAEQGVTPIRTYSEREAEELGLLVDESHQLAEGTKPERPAGSPMTIGELLQKVRGWTVRK